MWEDGEYIGVVIFAIGASPFLSKRYGLTQQECCELCRVALKGHRTEVSRIVAISLAFLKKFCPGMKLVVSFADPERGHHGGIYQAGNWLYTGRSNETIEYFVDGRWQHVRQAYYVAKGKNFPTRTRAGKFRYLMALDKETKGKIESLRQEFPKRGGSIAGDAPVYPTGEDGSTPIPPLQPSKENV